MSKLYRNVLLLAKIQTTAYTDPIPTAGANAILARAIDIQPAQVETEERANIQNFLGNQGKIITALYSVFTFEVELQSSGAAGTAPKFSPLLRACGFSETIVASTSVAYAPVTTGQEMVAFYWYMDGILHKMTDARGTVSFSLNAKGIPVMRFSFTGLYSTPSDATMPTGADYTGFKDPKPVSKANTPVFTVHGFSAKVQSLDIDIANQVVYRNLIGVEEVKITDRSPTGKILMEHPDTVAAKNWCDLVANGTSGALAVTHGLVAGSIIQFAGPSLVPQSIAYSDQDGVAMISCDLDIKPSTGNDELVVTFK